MHKYKILKILLLLITLIGSLFLIQNTFAQFDQNVNNIPLNNNTIGHQILNSKNINQINELNKILNLSIQNIQNTNEYNNIKNNNYNKKDVEEIIQIIDNTLKQLNYTFKKVDTFKISLTNKELDCDTAGIIYLSIAENLNLPMYGSKAPNHFYIIWNDNKQTYNIETTTATIKTNEFYINTFKINKNQIKKTYMNQLSKDQILSKKYEYKAVEEYNNKNYTKSEEYFKKALNKDNTNYNTLVNLGITQIKTQNFQEAKQNLEEAQLIIYKDKIQNQLTLLNNY